MRLSLWAAVCTPCWDLTSGDARDLPYRRSQSFSWAEFGPPNAVVHQVFLIKPLAITFLALLGFTGVILWYFTVSNQVNVNINCKMNHFFPPLPLVCVIRNISPVSLSTLLLPSLLKGDLSCPRLQGKLAVLLPVAAVVMHRIVPLTVMTLSFMKHLKVY